MNFDPLRTANAADDAAILVGLEACALDGRLDDRATVIAHLGPRERGPSPVIVWHAESVSQPSSHH